MYFCDTCGGCIDDECTGCGRAFCEDGYMKWAWSMGEGCQRADETT